MKTLLQSIVHRRFGNSFANDAGMALLISPLLGQNINGLISAASTLIQALKMRLTVLAETEQRSASSSSVHPMRSFMRTIRSSSLAEAFVVGRISLGC